MKKGITLISLVVTIVVLLILATVAISIAVDSNGLFSKAQESKDKYNMSQLKETVSITMLLRDRTKSLQDNLQEIKESEVQEVRDDLCYVTKEGATVTVYEDGDIIEGTIDVWNGQASEVPEIDEEFNWHIYTGAQLKFLADFVNNGNALTPEQKTKVAAVGYAESDITITNTTTVYLMNNLDLGARQEEGELTSGVQWTAIGLNIQDDDIDDVFNGVFEGNDHWIKGVYIKTSENYQGIFGSATNEIRNLTVKNDYIEGNSYVGGIVGHGFAVTKCHNIGTTVKANSYVGGVVGQAIASTKIVECTNNRTSVWNGKLCWRNCWRSFSVRTNN